MFNKTISAAWLITPILLALGSQATASELLRFKVFLGDKPIGEHSFRISESGDLTRVSSRAAFDVDFLFVNAYRYRHDSREVFRDGCLQEIRSTTDDNGKQYRVEGEAIGKQFRIEGGDGKEQADGCLMTFAYWDPSFLNQKRLLMRKPESSSQCVCAQKAEIASRSAAVRCQRDAAPSLPTRSASISGTTTTSAG